MCSALCLRPGAQCWQGRQAREASSRMGAGQEKPPGLRRWQEGCPGSCPRSLASELPGTGLAWCQQLWLRPFAESQGHKTEPSFQSDTKWSLHRAPQRSGPTQARVLVQQKGLEKHEVQPPSRASMLGWERMKHNATRVWQHPPPGRPWAEGLHRPRHPACTRTPADRGSAYRSETNLRTPFARLTFYRPRMQSIWDTRLRCWWGRGMAWPPWKQRGSTPHRDTHTNHMAQQAHS